MADVSVIIAAYNVERYIERAIRSALTQEGVAVEVIVVNDASTDNTSAVIASIGDPRVRYIDLSHNSGASIARNTAMALGTAPWTAVLDSDDAFLPGRLLRCMTRAIAAKADIVIDNVIIHREEDGAEYPLFPPGWFSRLGRHSADHQQIVNLACFIENNRSFVGDLTIGHVKPMFSSAFLRHYDLRYDPKIRIVEDYYFLAEALSNHARCVIEPSLGYAYTSRKGSISHDLTLADITHFADCERRFLSRHILDQATERAQKLRVRCFTEAVAYFSLVEALKKRKLLHALNIIVRDPRAAMNLRRPMQVRVRRGWSFVKRSVM